MRLHKHVAAVVAAGTLAASLACAPFALAGSLLQSVADQVGDTAEEVVTTAEESDSSALNELRAMIAAAGDTRSYYTNALGPVRLMLPEGWTLSTNYDASHDEYACETNSDMFDFLVYYSSVLGEEDDFTLVAMDGLRESVGDGVSLTFGALPDRYLDETLVRTLTFEASSDDIQATGILTFVFGEDYLTIMTYLWSGDWDSEGGAIAEQLVNGLSLVNGGVASYDDDSAYSDSYYTDYGSLFEAVEVEPGESFEISNWQITVDDDPAGLVWCTASDDFFLDNYAGLDMVAVPINITNVGDEAVDPFMLMVYTYTSDGLCQQDWPGIGFDDAIESIGTLQPGETAVCYLYAAYTGDGTYSFQFVDWESSADIAVSVQVSR